MFTAYMQEFIMDSTHLISLFDDKVHFRLLGIEYAINSKQRVKILMGGRFAPRGGRFAHIWDKTPIFCQKY